MHSTYRPMSDWERERWQEIVHACTSRPGGVEFGPQAKAVILAVARELEAAESHASALLLVAQNLFDHCDLMGIADARGRDAVKEMARLLSRKHECARCGGLPGGHASGAIDICTCKEDGGTP